MSSDKKKIAVLIPCYNEQVTISAVVTAFKEELPQADVYVFDNNSTDNTVAEAEAASAIVHHEYRQGKGSVVRAMFRKIEADYYVLVDGDDTYPASAVHSMIDLVATEKCDMCVGDRLSSNAYDKENKRLFHGFGNRLVRWLINKLFHSNLKDIMSGYRVFNRFMVKTFPVMSNGFEIETEMVIHALDKRLNIKEFAIDYKDRPAGSHSKLNTYTDGLRVLSTIVKLFKNYRPLVFFSSIAAVLAIAGLVVGAFPVIEYIQYSYVYKVPSAILAVALEIIAVLFLFCGFILDTVVTQNKERYEQSLLTYADE